jgi:hypothetical protein
MCDTTWTTKYVTDGLSHTTDTTTYAHYDTSHHTVKTMTSTVQHNKSCTQFGVLCIYTEYKDHWKTKSYTEHLTAVNIHPHQHPDEIAQVNRHTTFSNETFKSICTHSTAVQYDEKYGKYTENGVVLTQIQVPPPWKVGAGLGIKTCSGCVAAFTGMAVALAAAIAAGTAYAYIAGLGPFAYSFAELVVGMNATEFAAFVDELALELGVDDDVVEDGLDAIGAIVEPSGDGWFQIVSTLEFGISASSVNSKNKLLPEDIKDRQISLDQNSAAENDGWHNIVDSTDCDGSTYSVYSKYVLLTGDLKDRQISLEQKSLAGLITLSNKNKSFADYLTENKLLASSPFVAIAGGYNLLTRKKISLMKFKANKYNLVTNINNIFTSMRSIYFRNKHVSLSVKASDGDIIKNKLVGKKLLKKWFLNFNTVLKSKFKIDVSKYDVYTRDFYKDYYNNGGSPNHMEIRACIVSSICLVLWDVLTCYALKQNCDIDIDFNITFYDYLFNNVYIGNDIFLKNLISSFPKLQLSDHDVKFIHSIMSYVKNELENGNNFHDLIVVQHIIQFLDNDLSKIIQNEKGEITLDIRQVISNDKHKEIDTNLSQIMKIKNYNSKLNLIANKVLKKNKTQYPYNSYYDKDGNRVNKSIGPTNNIKHENSALKKMKLTNIVSNKDIIQNYLVVYLHSNKIRLGDKQEGGYVIAQLKNKFYDSYISAGINNNESFTRDFLTKYNISQDNAYAIDGDNNYPYSSYPSNKILFTKKYLGPEISDIQTNLMPIFKNYNDIFMKINARSKELNWLHIVDKDVIKKIKQLVLIMDIRYDDLREIGSTITEILRKINLTHQIIHIHAANNSPNKLELTYLRKDEIETPITLNNIPLPIKNLDYPNDPKYPEIVLHNMKTIKYNKKETN